MKRYYPLFLDLEDERTLVIGSGPLAEEKVSGLQRSGARVDHLEPAAYQPARLEGARLVIDCSGDDELGARVYRDAEARGILVNVLDRPARCRFIAPAVVDRHPLQVAISTAGESPYLAAALRRRLESLLGPEWGQLVALVGRARRQLRRRGLALPEQTETYRRLLRSPVRDLLRDGRADAAEAAAALIVAGTASRRPGRVALVGAGPGDPSLLTLAAVDALAEADLVLHDALVPPAVLRFASPSAELVAVGKRGGRPSARQEEINRRLVEAARAGRHVVRLKGGDPFVFGRGGEELQALLAAGIETTVVPGVSSAIASPAAAGIPLTLRGLASSVAFATASTAATEAGRLARLAAGVDTLVVMMGLAALEVVVAELVPVLGPARPAAVVSRATLPDQRIVRAPLGSLAAAARAARVAAPATLVIGEVVGALEGAQSSASAATTPSRAS